MTAVGPEALAASRSPPGARARAVVSEKMRTMLQGSFLPTGTGQGQRKAGSDYIRGWRKRVRADQTLVAP